jgi:hypothetical protein
VSLADYDVVGKCTLARPGGSPGAWSGLAGRMHDPAQHGSDPIRTVVRQSCWRMLAEDGAAADVVFVPMQLEEIHIVYEWCA